MNRFNNIFPWVLPSPARQQPEEPDVIIPIPDYIAEQECYTSPTSKHEWVEVVGIYKIYKDCKHCNLKWENYAGKDKHSQTYGQGIK